MCEVQKLLPGHAPCALAAWPVPSAYTGQDAHPEHRGGLPEGRHLNLHPIGGHRCAHQPHKTPGPTRWTKRPTLHFGPITQPHSGPLESTCQVPKLLPGHAPWASAAWPVPSAYTGQDAHPKHRVICLIDLFSLSLELAMLPFFHSIGLNMQCTWNRSGWTFWLIIVFVHLCEYMTWVCPHHIPITHRMEGNWTSTELWTSTSLIWRLGEESSRPPHMPQPRCTISSTAS